MAVIFDLDGTLVNSLNFHFNAFYNGLVEVLKIKIDPKFVMGNIVYPTSYALAAVEKKYGIKISKVQADKIVAFTNSSMNEKNVREGVKFYPGARETVELLKRSGIKIAIATSMNSVQLKIFTKVFGLNKLTGILSNPTSLKQDKPNPYILNKAIRRLKTDRRSVFYVGDAPTDYKAAKNAGIKFIGVRDQRLKDTGMFFKDMKALYRYAKSHLEDFE